MSSCPLITDYTVRSGRDNNYYPAAVIIAATVAITTIFAAPRRGEKWKMKNEKKKILRIPLQRPLPKRKYNESELELLLFRAM